MLLLWFLALFFERDPRVKLPLLPLLMCPICNPLFHTKNTIISVIEIRCIIYSEDLCVAIFIAGYGQFILCPLWWFIGEHTESDQRQTFFLRLCKSVLNPYGPPVVPQPQAGKGNIFYNWTYTCFEGNGNF